MAPSAAEARHKTVWPLVSLLLIADIVGAGILELPSNMARVGWIIGVILLALGAPLNVYTGMLLARMRNGVYPETTTYGELAGAIFGRPIGIAVAVVVYVNLAMTLGAYNLVLTRSTQALFYELDLCQPIASMLVCAVLMPFNQIQTLHGISTISAIGFVAIVVAVACCLGWAWFGDDARWDSESHELLPRGIGFFSAFAAMSGFTFAYAGQTIYLEILAEMKDARSFPKALLLSTPIMLVAYATVAFTGYGVAGSATPPSLMDVLPFDWRMIVANLFLIIHMVISYIITSQVLSRAFVNAVVPLLCPRLAPPLSIDLDASEALFPRSAACGACGRGRGRGRGSGGGRGGGALPTASELIVEDFDIDGGSAEETAAAAAAEEEEEEEDDEARRGGASSAGGDVELAAILRPHGVPESEGGSGAVHLRAGGTLTVGCILCTVTFHANHAHNLTRSP
jgi:amino acid permease